MWNPNYAAGSPIDTLLKTLNSDYSVENPLFYHVVTEVDSAMWLPAARNRIYIILIHRELGESVRDKVQQLFAESATCFESTSLPKVAVKEFLLPVQETARILASMEAGLLGSLIHSEVMETYALVECAAHLSVRLSQV